MNLWSTLFRVPGADADRWDVLGWGASASLLVTSVFLGALLILFSWKRRDLPGAKLVLLNGLTLLAVGSSAGIEIIDWEHATAGRVAAAETPGLGAAEDGTPSPSPKTNTKTNVPGVAPLIVRVVAALLSWGLAIGLTVGWPRLMAIQDPEMIRSEMEERRRVETKLKLLNETMEQRVAARTNVAESQARELREKEMRIRAILETAPDGIITVNARGVIESVNPAGARLFGYEPEELPGQRIEALIAPAQGGPMATYQTVAQEQGGAATIRDLYGRRKDGAGFPIDVAVSAVRVEGKLTYTQIIRDMSASKAAQQALVQRTLDLERVQGQLSAAARFAAALNQTEADATYQSALSCLAETVETPFAVLYARGDGQKLEAKCLVGWDGRVQAARMCDAEGLPQTVAESRTVRILNGPFPEQALKLRLGLNLGFGSLELQAVIGWPILFQDGVVGVLTTAHITPLGHEQREFIQSCLEQLAIRMNGFEIEQQRSRLLGDLQEKSRALEISNREAERANRVKSEFLANMSHELRTPMNSIMGFTQRLIRRLQTQLSERDLDALQTVDRNAKHLLGLINDILDLSKIEAGKMELRLGEFDLNDAAREVVEQTAPLAEAKALILHFTKADEPVPLFADRTKLIQIITNLVSNAIKYTEKGEITLAISRRPAAGRDALAGVIQVTDTGVGIAQDNLKRLFAPFSQLEAGNTRPVGGTGLGLFITSQYVRMHGGTIQVESAVDQGSVFTVTLPLHNPNQPAHAIASNNHNNVAMGMRTGSGLGGSERYGFENENILTNGLEYGGSKTPEAETGPASGALVLCVDDEPDALKYLQLTLQDHGYGVLLARDCETAVYLARTARPDLLCLDIGLPDKDGYHVLKELRNSPDAADLPVIVVSARSDEAQRLAVGAHCYLTKPVNADILIQQVRHVLGPEVSSALVVEDDPDTQRLLCESLRDHGIHPVTAGNGREALEVLQHRLPIPKVVLLDLMMPEMDGFEFLERMKRESAWRNIPVVVLTAMALGPAELMALSLLCDSILIKGRDETARVLDAILNAVLPLLQARRNARTEALPPSV